MFTKHIRHINEEIAESWMPHIGRFTAHRYNANAIFCRNSLDDVAIGIVRYGSSLRFGV